MENALTDPINSQQLVSDVPAKAAKAAKLRSRILIPIIVLNLFYIIPILIMFLSGKNKSLRELYTNLSFKSSILFNEINTQYTLLNESNTFTDEGISESFSYIKDYAEKKIITIEQKHEIVFALSKDGTFHFLSGLDTNQKLSEKAVSSIWQKNYAEFVFANNRYISICLPYKGTNGLPNDWDFVQVVAHDKEAFLSEINRNFLYSFVLILITIVLVILMIGIILRTTIRAVESLTHTINDIYENLNFDYEIKDIKDNTEVSYLTRTFAKMLRRISQYKKINILSIFDAVLSKKTEEKTRVLFQKYVPGELVKRMLTSSTKVVKGSIKKPTILFSDIRSFTTLSEQYSAEVVSETLNKYFSLMNDEIAARKGIVDKFIGDAIMALFNALDEFTDDREAGTQAVLCAVNMQKILFKSKIKIKENDPEFMDFLKYGLDEDMTSKVIALFNNFNIGIGLNTGDVIVGDIGSEKKMDFTAIGDKVNEASRLEGMTKYYDNNILVSDSTYELVKDSEDVVCIEIDSAIVKGKTEPTTIYFPISKQSAEYYQEHIENYCKAMDLYKSAKTASDWEEALRYFGKVDTNKIGTKALIERIRGKTPPEGWSDYPYYKMESK